MAIFSDCRIVLVRTSHAGNIGAVARAMKTMGLTQLYLVDPKDYPNHDAYVRATHAHDILDNAIICKNLEEALHGTVAAYALSSRKRGVSALPTDIRTATMEAVNLLTTKGPVAFVFGNEATGLVNDEITLCNRFAYIPASDSYYSLNLASAVQVICYEFRMAALAQSEKTENPDDTKPVIMATHEEYQGLYQHLQKAMEQTTFLDNGNHHRIMRRLRKLFDRTQLERKELMILRGILSAFERTIHKAHNPSNDE